VLPEMHNKAKTLGLDLINTAYTKETLNEDYYSANPCYIPFMNYYIAYDGNAYVCCFSRSKENCMGNIFKSSIEEITNSEAFREFRKGTYPFSNRKVCLRCIGEIRTNEKIKKWLPRED
jgi:radical SAM protein with 4Fe4S-binding SPASM domain